MSIVRTPTRVVAVAATVLIALAITVPVSAEPTSVPGGPYAPEAQGEPNRSSNLSFEEIEEELLHLEQRSRGALDVEQVGTSGEGRPLYTAEIGDGDTRMWIQGRIHGNEPYGAEASLELLKRLVAGGGNAGDVLEDITFMVVPIYNPDGSEEYQRGDVIEGIDLNRDWVDFQATESRAFWYAWEDFRPHYAIDIHHQGMNHQGAYYEGETNRMSTFSVGISLSEDSLDGDHRYDAIRQMGVVAAEAAGRRGNVNPTRYFPIDIPEGVVSAMLLGSPGPDGEDPDWETAGMFFESRGGIDQKSRGYLIGQNTDALWGVIDAVAGDELDDVDPDAYGDIPPRGAPITPSDKFPQEY